MSIWIGKLEILFFVLLAAREMASSNVLWFPSLLIRVKTDDGILHTVKIPPRCRTCLDVAMSLDTEPAVCPHVNAIVDACTKESCPGDSCPHRVAILKAKEACDIIARLTEVKDANGDLLFRPIHLKPSCDACLEAKKPDTCTHTQSPPPLWKKVDCKGSTDRSWCLKIGTKKCANCSSVYCDNCVSGFLRGYPLVCIDPLPCRAIVGPIAQSFQRECDVVARKTANEIRSFLTDHFYGDEAEKMKSRVYFQERARVATVNITGYDDGKERFALAWIYGHLRELEDKDIADYWQRQIETVSKTANITKIRRLVEAIWTSPLDCTKSKWVSVLGHDRLSDVLEASRYLIRTKKIFPHVRFWDGNIRLELQGLVAKMEDIHAFDNMKNDYEAPFTPYVAGEFIELVTDCKDDVDVEPIDDLEPVDICVRVPFGWDFLPHSMQLAIEFRSAKLESWLTEHKLKSTADMVVVVAIRSRYKIF